MVRPRLILCLVATVVVAGAAAPGALARPSAYSQILQVYQQRGSIPACQFSAGQLSAALKSVDTYGAQYFADFTNAIQDALSARAGGSCTPGPAASATASAIGGGRIALPPGPVTSPTQASLPLPIILLGALAAVMAVIGLLVAMVRGLAWEPGLVRSWRHLWAEASFRGGGVWADFADWFRSGS